MPFNEVTATNQLAAQERAIAGMRNSFDYARNPDSLTANMLPAAIHFIPSFVAEERGHHNVWRNTLTLQSVLFVVPRESQGGKLRFIENEAIPYGQKWRDRFQTESVIAGLLENTAATRFFLIGGDYGAGPPLLEYAGIPYIGWIFNFTVVSA